MAAALRSVIVSKNMEISSGADQPRPIIEVAATHLA